MSYQMRYRDRTIKTNIPVRPLRRHIPWGRILLALALLMTVALLIVRLG